MPFHPAIRHAFRRFAGAGLAAAMLLSAPLLDREALAASQCGMSPARQAFDVEGLKSELMVTALSCNQQDRYNAFVAKFRPDLTEQERALDAYFASSYGRAAQREHDNYITQLANVQSERGLQAGTQFCDQRVSMFDEVLALDTGSDLSGYAEAKDIVQPAVYETCAAPKLVKTSGHVRHVRSTGHSSHGRHRS
jgi:hypothetical protein